MTTTTQPHTITDNALNKLINEHLTNLPKISDIVKCINDRVRYDSGDSIITVDKEYVINGIKYSSKGTIMYGFINDQRYQSYMVYNLIEKYFESTTKKRNRIIDEL